METWQPDKTEIPSAKLRSAESLKFGLLDSFHVFYWGSTNAFTPWKSFPAEKNTNSVASLSTNIPASLQL